MYRDRGWARNRVKLASGHTHFVRIYEARVQWVDVTAQHRDLIDDTEISSILGWAGMNRFKRLLLEEPRLAKFVMRRHRLDRTVDRISDTITRARAPRSR